MAQFFSFYWIVTIINFLIVFGYAAYIFKTERK